MIRPFSAVILSILLIGCSSTPWSDESSPSAEPPPESVDVPAEDREQVDELLRARAAERERVAEANRRRDAALNDLSSARHSLREWQMRPESPERDDAVRSWQVRITELEEEVRKQNTALGRNPEEGLQPPTPPLPPTPSTPQ